MIRDAKSPVQRTWARPNRRRMGMGEYFPGNGYDNIYRLIVCIDVSGSVTEDMLKEMLGEVAALLEQNLVTNIRLISVDTKVQRELETASGDAIIGWDPGGGGGTDFRSALHHVSQLGDAVGMIFLTDMETGSYGENPGFPVVWVNWLPENGRQAPFGRTVAY